MHQLILETNKYKEQNLNCKYKNSTKLYKLQIPEPDSYSTRKMSHTILYSVASTIYFTNRTLVNISDNNKLKWKMYLTKKMSYCIKIINKFYVPN